jgi:hypothetical protein
MKVMSNNSLLGKNTKTKTNKNLKDILLLANSYYIGRGWWSIQRNTTAQNNIYLHTVEIIIQKLLIKPHTKTNPLQNYFNLISKKT